MLTCDQYFSPPSLGAAFDLMDAHRGHYRLVAGCTDLLPWARPARAGDVHYPVLIDLARIAELQGVERRGGRIRLGAGTTFQQFLEDAFLRIHLPVMPKCAIWFADDQIRQQATLAGNLVNASPAADGAPPVIAMNGVVTLVARRNGTRQERELPLNEFVIGPAETVLEEGEVLTAIECDALDGYGGAFKKVGHRRSLVISVACAATLVKVDKTGRSFEDVRIALGGVGPVPVRIEEVEEHLKGQPVARSVIDAAADLPVDRIRSRSRQEYRREVIRNFVTESIVDALADIGVRLDGDGEARAIHREPAEIRHEPREMSHG